MKLEDNFDQANPYTSQLKKIDKDFKKALKISLPICLLGTGIAYIGIEKDIIPIIIGGIFTSICSGGWLQYQSNKLNVKKFDLYNKLNRTKNTNKYN